MDKGDIRFLEKCRKRKLENSKFRMFIASKRGGNGKGDGKNRSTILATDNGKEWYQAIKFWGEDNEEQAIEFLKLFNQIKP